MQRTEIRRAVAANDQTKANIHVPFWVATAWSRQFKEHARLLGEAEGVHYTTADGRKVLDGTAGLWCCNAGHRRKPIVEAVQRQVEKLDFAPTFQMGHPLSFEFASRRSEEHTSELQSLMRISYAVFCLKKKIY